MSSISYRSFKAKNNSTFLVRNALPSDAKKLYDLKLSISKERIYSLGEPEEFRATSKSEKEKIKRFYEAEGKVYVVAEYRKNIIGLIEFDNFYHKKCTHNGLFTLFVKKSWRNKGIGKILLQQLLDWAKTNHLIRKVSLNVFSTNKNAIALYKKYGFKQEGYCPGDMIIDGKYVDSVLMYKFVK